MCRWRRRDDGILRSISKREPSRAADRPLMRHYRWRRLSRGVSHFYHKGNAPPYIKCTRDVPRSPLVRPKATPGPRPENTHRGSSSRARALTSALTRRGGDAAASRGRAVSFSSHRRGLASFRGRTKNRGSLVRDGKSPASAKGRNRERRSRWGVSGASKLD